MRKILPRTENAIENFQLCFAGVIPREEKEVVEDLKGVQISHRICRVFENNLIRDSHCPTTASYLCTQGQRGLDQERNMASLCLRPINWKGQYKPILRQSAGNKYDNIKRHLHRIPSEFLLSHSPPAKNRCKCASPGRPPEKEEEREAPGSLGTDESR